MARPAAKTPAKLDSRAIFLSTASKFRDEFYSEQPTGAP